MFKTGEQVQWTSSSNGSTTTKRGVVDAIVKAGKQPNRTQQKEADAYGASRDHESYLIRVPSKSGKGKLYWPRASLLKPASGDRTRILKPNGREVPELSVPISITITSTCPAKWVFVDLETGEIWGHDGAEFRRIARKDATDVATVVEKSGRVR